MSIPLDVLLRFQLLYHNWLGSAICFCGTSQVTVQIVQPTKLEKFPLIFPIPSYWNQQVRPTRGEIIELNTNVTLYMQRIPRLQVHWKDNLPNGEWIKLKVLDLLIPLIYLDTTYNVLVSAVNSTRCPDAPCSEYTIKGKPRNFIYLPQSPNLNVESSDCNYMFGCQYNVTVETSNLLVRRSMRVFIPRNCSVTLQIGRISFA